jgi:chromosome segregation ATPase
MFNEATVIDITSRRNGEEGDAVSYFQDRLSDPDREMSKSYSGVGEFHAPDVGSHTKRVLRLIAELSSISDRTCNAALKGAECCDRMDEIMARELTSLREQLARKDESLLGLEMALAKSEQAAKERIEDLEGRLRGHESQLSEQQIELRQLRSGRDYLSYRLNEIEVAAKDAEVQAERLRDRLQKEIVESKLEIARCKREVSDKETEMRKVATESRTTIEELRLRQRETGGKLANRDKGLEANRQKSSRVWRAREKPGGSSSGSTRNPQNST